MTNPHRKGQVKLFYGFDALLISGLGGFERVLRADNPPDLIKPERPLCVAIMFDDPIL